MPSDLADRLRAELAPELEVLRLLGEGSHAAVFLAREPALKRLVAVKVLHPSHARDTVMRRRFQREAQSAASIRHPNVIPIHRIQTLEDGLPCIIMEYIDGRTLADLIAARGPLPVDEANTILVAVASALAAAHERGIVHRDVRPGNVFIENNTGRAVLADFGIAALMETGADTVTRLTTGGMRLGDVKYMSPEQLRGESVTEQSDVYALGMLGFETLTGRIPFDQPNAVRQMAARLKDAPPSPASLRPGIPPDLAATIVKCLAVDARHRPRAHELARRLAPDPAAAAPDRPQQAGPLSAFLNELRRRRVYQVAMFYIVFGGGSVSLARDFGDGLGVPAGAVDAMALVVALGFPAALVLSWLYDITAGGIRRTSQDGASKRVHGPAWVPWVGLTASIALALLIWWFFGLRD
ncbi:MAG: serine/threonine-protein kinase [Longimicrobiales bacterium]